MKSIKYILTFLLVLSFFSMYKTNEASAHTVNSCASLKKLVGADAISFEKGNQKTWNNVHSDLIKAKDQYVKALNAKGWTIDFTSMYRPQEYQEHLREVLTKKKAGDKCALAEYNYHGLGSEVAVVSNHTKGLAFDAIIRTKNGVALNGKTFVNSQLVAVAESVGLKFPLPSTDGVHHELKKAPSTQTLTAYNATGTINKKTYAQKAAGTTSGNFGYFSNGNKVTIVGIQGSYYKIKYNTGYAFVLKADVNITTTATTQQVDNNLYAYNAAGVVNKKSYAQKAAGTTSGNFGYYSNGNKVTIVGVQGTYYKIKYNTTFAYLLISDVNATTTEVAKTGTATIASSNGFNIRKYPYETSPKVGSVAKNATVTLLAISGDWYKVKAGTVTGYIKGVKSGVTVAAVKSEYPKTGYVKTQSTSLNVRATASTSAKIVATAKKDAAVTITGKSGNWYSVKVGTVTGWVSADYITFTKPVVSAYPKTGYVNTQSTTLNVRVTASVSAKIVTTIKKNAAVTITGKSGNWYSVKVGTVTGWVSADYIIFDKNKLTTQTGSYEKTNISVALPKSLGKAATDDTFNKYLPTLGLIEGGYSNHPKDLGGETNLGVTATLYKAYYPKKNIKNITSEEAKKIFYKEFWKQQVTSTKMSERLAVVLFDTAVNMGNDDATKSLQKVMGFTGKNVDGINGSATKKKLATYTIAQQDVLALQVLQIRKNYRAAQNEFKEGWANRDKKLYEDLKRY